MRQCMADCKRFGQKQNDFGRIMQSSNAGIGIVNKTVPINGGLYN